MAARQHGVVTHAQLRAAGLTRSGIARRVESRRLQPVYPRVFAVGHAVLTPNGRRLAAVLACGPRAAGSHGTAVVVHGLGKAPARHHITVPRGGPHSRGDLVVHRVGRLALQDVEVLSPHRLAKRMELGRVFDLVELRATMARNPGRRGLKPVADTLRRLDGATDENALQAAFLELCRRLGLREPEQQVQIGPHTVDFLWPDAGLVVETDGREYHATRAAFGRDRRRDIDLAARGLRVLRVDWWQVAEPAPALVTTLSRLAAFGTI